MPRRFALKSRESLIKRKGYVLMAVAIRIPAADPTTEEVRIIRWLKGKGQAVVAGEPILEVETDKATMEVESFADGILLEILAKEDDQVEVSKVVAIVGQKGENISELLKTS